MNEKKSALIKLIRGYDDSVSERVLMLDTVSELKSYYNRLKKGSAFRDRGTVLKIDDKRLIQNKK